MSFFIVGKIQRVRKSSEISKTFKAHQLSSACFESLPLELPFVNSFIKSSYVFLYGGPALGVTFYKSKRDWYLQYLVIIGITKTSTHGIETPLAKDSIFGSNGKVTIQANIVSYIVAHEWLAKIVMNKLIPRLSWRTFLGARVGCKKFRTPFSNASKRNVIWQPLGLFIAKWHGNILNQLFLLQRLGPKWSP